MSLNKLTLLLSISLILYSCNSQSGGDEFSNDLTFHGTSASNADAIRGARIAGIDPISGTRRTDCLPGSGCEALFEGISDDGKTNIHSNGRVCADCHRTDANLQLGSKLPLHKSIPADDPLIRFVDADAQFNPDAPKNLNDFGLILIRPYRFKGLALDDPFRKYNIWRKIPTLNNLAFARGFVADLRNNTLESTDISATQTHTQVGDIGFSKLADGSRINDLVAFQFSLLSDPRFFGMLHPEDSSISPSYNELIADPFLTVAINTPEEKLGKEVFQRFCFTCHNVPNVFNNASIKDPHNSEIVGKGFDIGIGQANFLDLDFRYFNPETGGKELITLPLKKQNGEIVMFPITRDIGLAAITKKYEDLFVFKVPQLRNLQLVAPFMHDGSIKTIEDVVHYFNSDTFNSSAGGQAFPIHMTNEEEEALIKFLRNL